MWLLVSKIYGTLHCVKVVSDESFHLQKFTPGSNITQSALIHLGGNIGGMTSILLAISQPGAFVYKRESEYLYHLYLIESLAVLAVTGTLKRVMWYFEEGDVVL